MNTRARLAGILGCVFLFFSQVIYFFLPVTPYLLFILHLALGICGLLYFLLFGGLNFLKDQSENRNNSRFHKAVFRISLISAAIILFNLLINRFELFEYDSTANKVYSLAPETEEIIKTLPGKLAIKAFYLGGIITNQNIKNILNKLSSYGVDVRMIDPEKELTLLEAYGVTQTETLHFSLETKQGEKRVAKIAHVNSEDEIVSTLKKLTRAGARTVLYSTGHGEPNTEDKLEQGYLFFKEAVEGENLQLKTVSLAAIEKVDSEAKAVIISAPKESFGEKERKVVAEYLSRGGNLLLFNEPRTSNEISKLVAFFGIEVGENLVVEPAAGSSGLSVQPRLVGFSKKSPITKTFTRSAIFTTSTSVKAQPKDDDRSLTTLAYTSENGWAESDLEKLFAPSPLAARDERDILGPVPLAVARDGTDTKFSGRIVVFGDSDFVSNSHLRELANRDLALNALNWVIGEEILSGTRNRTLLQTTTKLSAEELERILFIGMILIPEILLIIALRLIYLRTK